MVPVTETRDTGVGKGRKKVIRTEGHPIGGDQWAFGR